MPAQNAATILQLLVPNPHSTPFTYVVQYVADWVAPILRSQHSPPPSLRARELRAIIIIFVSKNLLLEKLGNGLFVQGDTPCSVAHAMK